MYQQMSVNGKVVRSSFYEYYFDFCPNLSSVKWYV